MTNSCSEQISERTRAASEQLLGATILSSDDAVWSSLHVRVTETGPVIDNLQTLPTPDPMVIMVLGSGGPIEYLNGGSWKKEIYGDGTGCVVAGGGGMRARWHLPSRKPLRIAHVYVPYATAQRVALELSDSSIGYTETIVERPYLDQRSISNTVHTVISAIESGAPDFFAQTAAQWLALQLLVPDSKLNVSQLSADRTSDFRLERVLQYMEANLSEPLSLEVLAREAGISRFHFIGLFRRALGTTPHKHLLDLRLQVAASMLLKGDKGVLEVALACGFQSSSHFAAVFKQKFHASPTTYKRRKIDTGRS